MLRCETSGSSSGAGPTRRHLSRRAACAPPASTPATTLRAPAAPRARTPHVGTATREKILILGNHGSKLANRPADAHPPPPHVPPSETAAGPRTRPRCGPPPAHPRQKSALGPAAGTGTISAKLRPVVDSDRACEDGDYRAERARHGPRRTHACFSAGCGSRPHRQQSVSLTPSLSDSMDAPGSRAPERTRCRRLVVPGERVSSPSYRAPST